MQKISSPCIWGRLKKIIIINPAAVLCAGIFMFSKWLGHSGAISTKDLHKLNRSATTADFSEDHSSFPCLRLKTTEKALLFYCYSERIHYEFL